ncbi:MAG TPA: glycosyl transferase family 4 [Gammaproteobacteria bacterium]|nr:glycosyl transferase family 4 [Gammaproteobacteria bacterium]|tara:strand:- start:186 stop:1202 length:1017 start_codon:yes stop_codon:yes gene_type:complete
MVLSSIVFFATMLGAAILTRHVRRYALERNLVDLPNARGLHEKMLPRGGGAAIVIVVSLCLIVLQRNALIDERLAVLWVGCGVGFGLLGWVDDHIDISSLIRFISQLVLASGFCIAVFMQSSAETLWWAEAWRLLGTVFVSVAIVWFVNLYNFMDGADGFAGSEAVVVASAGAFISGAFGQIDTMLLSLAIAGATAGFLIWNWEPARIFLGDVGSYFLGFQFCALTIYDLYFGAAPWKWLILLSPFITDATLTLLRRMFKRERWWQAHRSHIYQLLILHGRSHAKVSVSLAVGTLLVLFPIAWISVEQPVLAPQLAGVTYVLTGIIWFLLRKKFDSSI